MQGAVDGKLPFQRPFTCSRNNRRQHYLFMPHPHEDLPYRLKFGEFGENECDRISRTAIRNQFDPIIVGFPVTYCHGQEELPAAGLFIASIERWRKTLTSISLNVPFIPSTNRSLGIRGS
jgi:hypothetical protein